MHANRPTPEMVAELVRSLTLDEKALLTAGSDMWSTAALDRLDIPRVRVTDGPNGARGSSFLGSGEATSVCVPCGSALGAPWNPALIEQVGAMLGDETRTKACRVLLAPTINIHRSPLSGRNFECYSEDPLLSGRLAAAFIRGVQSRGVLTTVKHFAGNEAEFERNTISSVIDERSLREIYLLPFELAVTEGGSWGIMTAYNRLNGSFCTEDRHLLEDVLRNEWGFDGIVMTDWFGFGSTVGCANAGLDLEMPGPGRVFGGALADAVRAGEVAEERVDAKVLRLLGVFARLGAFADDPDAPEQSIDRPEHRALAREAATEAIVLLVNSGVLPLDPGHRTVAVLGPNADRAQIMGGGSAALRPHYRLTPLEAIRTRLSGQAQVSHERGCDIDEVTPPLGGSELVTPDGAPGLAVEYFADPEFGGSVVHRANFADGRILFLGDPLEGRSERGFSLRAHGVFTPSETGIHTFTLAQVGRARLLVEGATVIDGLSNPLPPGGALLGVGSAEVSAPLALRAGATYPVTIEYSSRGAAVLYGVKVGCRAPAPPDLLDRAVQLASRSDVAIVIVGTNDDWETEGRDRLSMDLPGAQDDLIARVAAANPNTIVVVNSGSPVTMNWAADVGAVVQAWFGGQEMANAIADVLTGQAEPAGRLPTTIPLRLEHNPSFGNFPGEGGQVRYGEGLLVGYRWYDARCLPVRFPFGHGLSYTTSAIGAPRLSAEVFTPGASLTVEVDVTNTGSRRGAEVVQCYVAPMRPRVFRPGKELKAFAKTSLDPGETATVRLRLTDRSFAYWDPGDPGRATVKEPISDVPFAARRPRSFGPAGWRVDPGDYQIQIGRSAAEIIHRVDLAVVSTP